MTRALLLLALLSACGGGVQADPGPRPASVLLIAVDGLRADRVGCYGYPRPTTPHLDALAARGLRYSDVASPAPWTAPALAALLTGRYPSAIGWTDLALPLPYEADLISERLSAAGYATGAVVNSPLAAVRFNLDQGFDDYRQVGLPPEDADDDDVFPPSASEVTTATLELVEAAGARPFFVLAHYSDPLPPWDVPERFMDPGYVGPIEAGLSLREMLRLGPGLNSADQAALTALGDAALAGVDAEIGRLFEGLEARGRAADTYLVVVGTSGVELFEHGELGVAKRLYDELVHVPWLLAGPRIAPGLVEDPASLIDVTPTLLELLAQRPAPRADGVAVLPGLAPPARVLISETDRARALRAVVEGNWKLIHDRQTGASELYDLLVDPGERTDLARRRPEVVEALLGTLDAWELSCAAE
jgi:arylsulfatase A-like enzyme